MKRDPKRYARPGAPRWGERDAREALDELAKSEKSMAEFASERGVSAQRIMYWKKRFAKSSKVRFEPVTFPANSVASVGPTPESTIAIAVGDVLVRVREDLDIERVARLVLALAGRPC